MNSSHHHDCLQDYLFSVSWTSAVSVVLDVQQRGIIDLFRQRLQGGNHLANAYDTTNLVALDAYYLEWIDSLMNHVDNYLNHMDANVDYVKHAPSDPDLAFNSTLDELSNFVYLIRYSNLSILNNLKRDLGPISAAFILVIINDQYVRSVSEQYGINKNAPAERSFETNIVDVVSMNKSYPIS
jgi:hypothetical protein